MKKPRSIKTLLEIMLYNQNLFENCLCLYTGILFGVELISLDERRILLKYINNNRPSMFSSLDAFIHSSNGYFWTPTDIKPRIKWIQKHIKLNS